MNRTFFTVTITLELDKGKDLRSMEQFSQWSSIVTFCKRSKRVQLIRNNVIKFWCLKRMQQYMYTPKIRVSGSKSGDKLPGLGNQ